MYSAISPLEFRYLNFPEAESLRKYFSEEGFIYHLALVESKLVATYAHYEHCSSQIATQVHEAVDKITVEDVYAEEKRIHHQLRAVVNCMAKHVSQDAKPWIHLGATSHDIVCTTDAYRFKQCSQLVLQPVLLELQAILISIAEREKNTVQVGRTHGQHAVPITFGFAVAEYVSRLGTRIVKLQEATDNLCGQFSGAVGAYNAQSLLVENPIEFEKTFLGKLGLSPATHSTQIVEPEFMLDYLHACTSTLGVLANLSDDMRHLQRTEIGEVMEEVSQKQVGSSTMPHKRNPIHFEHVKSLWKTFMPRMTTGYMDQISEHQRDLTNSASARFYGEIATALYLAARRLKRVFKGLIVDKEALQRNLQMAQDKIIAEPLYIMLAKQGHPDAHEAVRRCFIESDAIDDLNLSEEQKQIINNPQQYIGVAIQKTQQVCDYWRQKLHKK
ncbi:lyase family protein [Candidatus Uabimicrobium amorphum]|uniref:Adenylosuccinate lyase n=1 Tax=Uabimicrobium amorphum TaxID=2596890 RepID=A0A5S9F2S2_UABAM|nr:lyase family protein [Candidatus Uabimicrobium amorphum]BBM83977.1 adenylosuccinate lyase [Candidatus Uabimicrobium amorphum]